MTVDSRTRLRENLDRVRRRIEDATRRSGRPAGSVTLVAVTKSVEIDVVQQLYDLGERDFAENRPQALWARHSLLPADVRWRLIGHLQTNKVRRTLPLVTAIDSIDRMAVAEEVSREAIRLKRRILVAVEANLTGEEQKHGLTAEELKREWEKIIALPGLEVVGLMGMAAIEDDPERCRPTFAALRALRDELEAALMTQGGLPVLSMGMSGDFEIAVEEGATHVRIGSALFEGIGA